MGGLKKHFTRNKMLESIVVQVGEKVVMPFPVPKLEKSFPVPDPSIGRRVRLELKWAIESTIPSRGSLDFEIQIEKAKRLMVEELSAAMYGWIAGLSYEVERAVRNCELDKACALLKQLREEITA